MTSSHPLSWQETTVSAVADVNPQTLLPFASSRDVDIPVYHMADIDEDAGTLREPHFVPISKCRSGKVRFTDGDILFARITPCVENRKCALATGIPGGIAFGSSEFYVLRPRKPLTPAFLFFFLRQQNVIDAATESFTGTSGRQRVPKGFWDRLPIPLPPLPVQERIVAILQKADEIRRKRREALQIADQILPALFIEMFGDPATNPKSWPSLPLGQLAETKMGSTPKTDMPDYWQPATVPWVTPADMEKGTVNRVHFGERAISPAGLRNSSATLLPTSAVLLTTTATIGKIGIAKCPLATNQQVTGIICGPELDSSYLAYYLLLSGEESIADLGGASTATHVNQANLRRFKVPLPPLPQQQRFADYALAYETVHAKLQASLRDAETTFYVLLQQAFTGELTAEWEARNANWIAERQAFYKRLPQLVLLAFLHEKAQQARKASVLITALMKYAFLLQMEGSSRRRLYNFVPYHYGPFAQEVYSDLENLQQQGLVIIEEDDEKTRINLTAPDKVEQALQELPEDLRQDIAAIVETYGNLDHEGLLKVVYERYPAYAKKSRRRQTPTKPTE